MGLDLNAEILSEIKKVSRILALTSVRDMERPDAVVALSRAGYTSSEIADFFETSAGSVRKTLSRAKNSK